MLGVKTFGNLYTRCVLGLGALPLVRGGMPGADSAAAAAGVTAEAFFFQSPGYMTIVMQSNNDVRIIPTDNRPHVPSQVRQWLGDSRGHWEGNTLVVESTNFNDPKPATHFLGSTDSLQIVERFTRVGPNTMRYQYTVTDPKTWTRPWSVDTTMPRIDPSMIYEFACHEQNYGLINVVTGTQIRDREGTRDHARWNRRRPSDILYTTRTDERRRAPDADDSKVPRRHCCPGSAAGRHASTARIIHLPRHLTRTTRSTCRGRSPRSNW